MTAKDRQLNQAFRALAESGVREAPPQVEAVLRLAFRKQVRGRRIRHWTGAGVGILAASALMALALRRPPELAPPDLPMAHVGVPEMAARTLPRVPVSVRRSRPRRAVRSEVVSQFYPLPDADMLVPLEYGTVVRMELPRSALRVAGFPVNENRFSERIEADVLLGQDGLARAVRFVR